MREQLQLALYRLHLNAHWHPREQRILGHLSRLVAGGSITRVIDVGCGPGDLARSVSYLGLEYFGCDPDVESIELARRRFGDLDAVSFHIGGAGSLAHTVKETDIIVLNGVAHHLDDDLFSSLLCESLGGRYLLILDHDVIASVKSVKDMIACVLQRGDRGKFLRRIESFQEIAGWNLLSLERFLIAPLGVPCWPYFCALYEPSPRS